LIFDSFVECTTITKTKNMGQTESAEAQTIPTTAVDSNSNSSDPTSLESVIAG
jgi:hypothetical protein